MFGCACLDATGDPGFRFRMRRWGVCVARFRVQGSGTTLPQLPSTPQRTQQGCCGFRRVWGLQCRGSDQTLHPSEGVCWVTPGPRKVPSLSPKHQTFFHLELGDAHRTRIHLSGTLPGPMLRTSGGGRIHRNPLGDRSCSKVSMIFPRAPYGLALYGVGPRRSRDSVFGF